MRRFWFIFCLALLVLIIGLTDHHRASAGAITPITREMTAAELTRLEAGEIILESQRYTNETGETRGRGLAVGYIKADQAKIMAALKDFASYPQWMPRVKETKVYLNTPTQINVKFVLKVVISVTYHIKHYINDGAGTITWELDKSQQNEIRDTTGSWLIKPYKQGCLAYYSVALDTGRSMPAWLEDYLAKKDLPNVVKALKTRVGG